MSLDLAYSRGPRDAEWDAFVATVPGGHHVQTARWGAVKGLIGWRAARSIVRRDGEVVAGCQILLRGLGPVGKVAFAPRAPLTSERDPEALDAALEGVERIAAAENVRLLKVQAPIHRLDLGAEFERRGFRPSALEAAPLATVLVDLKPEEDELLLAMRASTRSNIRKAERRGVRVRVGGAADLGTFADLVIRTSQRQGFSPYPSSYYEKMWRAFAPAGDAHLLLAEHEGRVLSGVLILGFNDTAVYKMGGWMGVRSNIHPNELLHWTAMRWARARGHRYYDLEGIPVGLARSVLEGGRPVELGKGTARFKLGFGGEVRVFPGAYDLVRPRLLDVALRTAESPRFRGVVHRVLGRE